MSISQKRLSKGWSQSQLAEFSNLSVRTIQRIEKGQKPTMESLKALASVFETNIAEINAIIDVSEHPRNEQGIETLQQVQRRKDFTLNLLSYFLIVPLVCLANWLFAPQSLWGPLMALGWGIWLSYEAFYVFNSTWGKWQLKRVLRRVTK